MKHTVEVCVGKICLLEPKMLKGMPRKSSRAFYFSDSTPLLRPISNLALTLDNLCCIRQHKIFRDRIKVKRLFSVLFCHIHLNNFD